MLHPARYNRSLMIPKSSQDKGSSNQSISSKDHLCCGYYGKTKHTRETCWQLYEHPNKRQGRKKIDAQPQPYMTNINHRLTEQHLSITSFSKEDLVNLQQLMAKIKLDSSSTTVPSSYFVHTCIPTTALSVSTNHNISNWVIELESLTQITGSFTRFLSYFPCSGQR